VADVGGIAQRTEYGYDRLGRQTAITGYADGSTAQTTTYTLDKLDRVTYVTYPDSAAIHFAYNGLNQVSQRTDQRSIETTYEYDKLGNLLSKSATQGGVTTVESYSYDGIGRMRSAAKTQGGSAVSYSTFSYAATGNPSGKVTGASESLFGGTAQAIA
jgi:YD repeat-containing protein